MPRKGGIAARARRTARRATKQHNVKVSNSPYGPVVPLVIQYYGRFDVNQSIWHTGYNTKEIPFGNNQIFSGSYSKFNIFHEYRVLKAKFILRHELIKSSSWTQGTHPEIVTYSVGSFINDYEMKVVPDSKGATTWDTVMSHPGIRTITMTSNQVKHQTHVWRPTEASDTEWRLTNDDGICYIYVVTRCLDQCATAHQLSTVLKASIHIQLRGMDIETSDSRRNFVPPPTAVSQDRDPSPSFDGEFVDFRPTTPEELSVRIGHSVSEDGVVLVDQLRDINLDELP